jgi:flagellar protein FlaG
MEVNPMAAAASVSALTHLVSPELKAENREVIKAVKAINAAGIMGDENELMFSLDRDTHRVVVKIVDTNTNEVVRQVPAEVVLRMAEDTHAKYF